MTPSARKNRAVLTPSIEGCGFHLATCQGQYLATLAVLTPSIEGCGFHHAGETPPLRALKRLNPLDRRVWFSSAVERKLGLTSTVVLTPSIEGCGFHPQPHTAPYQAAPEVLTPSIEGCGFHPHTMPARPAGTVLTPSIEGCGFHLRRRRNPLGSGCIVLTPSIEGCGFHLPPKGWPGKPHLGSLNPLDRRVWFSSGIAELIEHNSSMS